MLGNWWYIVISVFSNVLYAAIVPFFFIFVNYYSLKKPSGFLQNLERTNSKSYGLVLYPLSLVIMVIASYATEKPYFGGIGVMALAYGDGFAALIGSKFSYCEYKIWGKRKTLTGSLAMLLFSFMSICILFIVAGVKIYSLPLVAVCLVATIVEAITPLGFDNISIPLVAVVTYSLLVC